MPTLLGISCFGLNGYTGIRLDGRTCYAELRPFGLSISLLTKHAVAPSVVQVWAH